MKAFALIELLISLCVLAIITLSTIAFFTKNQAGLEPAFELYQDLQLARSEAIARQHPVTLCPIDDAHHCTSEWGQSYKIFFTEQGRMVDLKVHTLTCDGLTGHTTFHQPITFSPTGYCHQQGSLTVHKHKTFTKLIFLRSGRIRLASGNSS